MEQNNFARNLTLTVMALGLSLSLAGNNASATSVHSDFSYAINNKNLGADEFQHNSVPLIRIDNTYIQNEDRTLDKEAYKLFGNMREETPKERNSFDNYINEISVKTGVNFFDLC